MSIYLAILCAMLSSPDWSVRENATALLDASPDFVAHALAQSEDLEIRSRAVRSLDARRVAGIRRLLDANRPVPWIDALPPEWPSRREIIDEFVRQTDDMLLSPDFYFQPGWPKYRLAMQLYLYTLTVEEARKVLSVCPKYKYWNGSCWVPWVSGVPEECFDREGD